MNWSSSIKIRSLVLFRCRRSLTGTFFWLQLTTLYLSMTLWQKSCCSSFKHQSRCKWCYMMVMINWLLLVRLWWDCGISLTGRKMLKYGQVRSLMMTTRCSQCMWTRTALLKMANSCSLWSPKNTSTSSKAGSNCRPSTRSMKSMARYWIAPLISIRPRSISARV